MFSFQRKSESVGTCSDAIAAGVPVLFAGVSGVVQEVILSSNPRIGLGLLASVLFADGSCQWIPVWQLTVAAPVTAINPLDTVIVTDGKNAEYTTVLIVRRRTVYVQLLDYPDEFHEFDKRAVFAVQAVQA